ncbi:hypothetical protein K470DRAFT_254399 [Piedraia hortae CBS 480.64]|uniref:DUF1279 domain-containing protein n=1 Tax=Piedraia hortae CBS 480.64 TaxID=1314780 RepID=A0A6A7C9F1_9PEZI|nr:hypothetical protein K470DRAFT_254399 [Piedraia hortae CBS 480.64]
MLGRRFLALSRTRTVSTRPPWRCHRLNSTQTPAQKPTSRFKELSRKYGYAAVGVYLGLSVLDFPLCFLAVQWLGTDRIAQAEHAVVKAFWQLVGSVGLDMRSNKQEEAPSDVSEIEADVKSGKRDASIWTQLLLAYGVHKSLIFFRIPLTAAVTPKLVKFLRARGWNIGRPSK